MQNSSGSADSEMAQQLRWRNFNAFEAKMLARDMFDCYKHPLWAFRDALEEEAHRHIPRALAVNIALDWLEIAGKQLFTLHVEQGRSSAGGTLWRGPTGYNARRWEFWAMRLEKLSEDDTIDAGTRARAAKGAETIHARDNGK